MADVTKCSAKITFCNQLETEGMTCPLRQFLFPQTINQRGGEKITLGDCCVSNRETQWICEASQVVLQAQSKGLIKYKVCQLSRSSSSLRLCKLFKMYIGKHLRRLKRICKLNAGWYPEGKEDLRDKMWAWPYTEGILQQNRKHHIWVRAKATVSPTLCHQLGLVSPWVQFICRLRAQRNTGMSIHW